MSKASNALFRAGLAAGTIGALMSAGLMFANIASAEVTGYQTRYSYHQGLAIGAGARLEQQAGAAVPSNSVVSTSAVQPSTTATPANSSGATNVTSPATAPASNPSVGPAVTGEGAANTNAATAPNTAAAQTASTLSQPLTLALWIVIALAAIALIAAVIVGVVNASRRESRTRQRVTYQNS